MAKKAAAKKPAKEKPDNSKRNAKEPEIPAIAGTVAPSAAVKDETVDPDEAIVDFCYNRGYAIDKERFLKLTEAERKNIAGWVDSSAAGRKTTVPASLKQFDTAGGTIVRSKETGMVTYCISAEFGKMSFGAESASIGLKIPKTSIKPAQIESLFPGKRCKFVMVLEENADRLQKRVPGSSDPAESLVVECDISGYSSRKKYWSTSLNFSAEDADAGRIAHFAKKMGRVEITGLGPSAKRGKPADDDDDAGLFEDDEDGDE